jgi:hypothetical protein
MLDKSSWDHDRNHFSSLKEGPTLAAHVGEAIAKTPSKVNRISQLRDKVLEKRREINSVFRNTSLYGGE